MEERQSFQLMVLGKLDTYIKKKKDLRIFFNAIHKSKHKMD